MAKRRKGRVISRKERRKFELDQNYPAIEQSASNVPFFTPESTTLSARRLGVSKLHIEPGGSLEVIDWIVLDNWYADLQRYCEILSQAPPHAEIERQE